MTWPALLCSAVTYDGTTLRTYIDAELKVYTSRGIPAESGARCLSVTVSVSVCLCVQVSVEIAALLTLKEAIRQQEIRDKKVWPPWHAVLLPLPLPSWLRIVGRVCAGGEGGEGLAAGQGEGDHPCGSGRHMSDCLCPVLL